MSDKSAIRFMCAVCGMRSPQPILCTKDDCPTDVLMNAQPASVRKH